MDSSSVPQTGNDGSEPSGSSKYGHVSPLATNEDKGNWKEDRRSTRLVLAITIIFDKTAKSCVCLVYKKRKRRGEPLASWLSHLEEPD